MPYLDTLARAGLVDVWSDRQLRGGDRWREEIGATLEAASVAVLLISQNFLASQFVRNEELPRILERQSLGRLTLLPVYLSPSTVTSDAIVFRDAKMREQRLVLSLFQGFGSPETTRNGKATIVPKRDVDIGQRFELSAGDVLTIHALYGTSR